MIYERLEGDITATVLAVRSERSYLIQLDPIQLRSPHEHPLLKAALDEGAALMSQMAANPADLQEAFEVDGLCLFLIETEGGKRG